MNDYELMLICAVRYALGRQTYIVGVVCSYITAQVDTLSEHCLRILEREIREQKQYGYGADCDKENWIKLYVLIKEQLRDRVGGAEK